MSAYGVFESSLTSDIEVGIAKAAAADKMNAACYDVREKLGPFLFAASSLEEFRDRVAMVKNDQSLFKIIEGAGLHPATGTVRRIAGRNSILENEWRQRHAAPDPTVSEDGRAAPGLPPNPVATRPPLPSLGQSLVDAAGSESGFGLDHTSRKAVFDSVNKGTPKGNDKWDGALDTDITFKDKQDTKLKPKGDFKSYLKSVDQDARSKVDGNCFIGEGTEHTEDPAKHSFASKTAWNLYLAWCDTNGHHPSHLASLDAYATNLNDVQYLKLAKTIQAWDNEYKPRKPSTKLKKKDKVAVAFEDFSGGDEDVSLHEKSHNPAETPWEKRVKQHGDQRTKDIALSKSLFGAADLHDEDKGRRPIIVEESIEKESALGRYISWCDRNNVSKVAKSTIDYYAQGNPRLRKHLYSKVATTIRWAKTRRHQAKIDELSSEEYEKKRRNGYAGPVHELMSETQNHPAFQGATHWHMFMGPKGTTLGPATVRDSRQHQGSRRTAAPDYLQKADDALTQLLNQKAEEFQQTIAPLQQALMTVQQAEQLQQQQNPMNVLPPAGTVNVMPGQGGAQQPSPEDTQALAQLLSGGGGPSPTDAPVGGPDASAPPPGATGGGLPPELDPSQQQPQQMQARRRHAEGVGQLWDKFQNSDQNTIRGDDSDYDNFASQFKVGPRALNKLKKQHQQGVMVGKRGGSKKG